MSSFDFRWSNKNQTNQGNTKTSKERIRGPKIIGPQKISMKWLVETRCHEGEPAAGTPKSLTYGRSSHQSISGDAVDGRNPAPADMVDIHRYRIIYRVLYIPGGAGFLPSTVCHRGKVSAKLYQEELYFGRCFWGEIGFMVLTTATTFVASSHRPHFGRYLQQGGSVHFHLRSCSSTPWKLHRTRQWDEMKRCPRVVSGEPVRPIRLCQRLEALHQFIWAAKKTTRVIRSKAVNVRWLRES